MKRFYWHLWLLSDLIINHGAKQFLHNSTSGHDLCVSNLGPLKSSLKLLKCQMFFAFNTAAFITMDYFRTNNPGTSLCHFEYDHHDDDMK